MMIKISRKGFSETKYVFAFMLFLAFIGWLSYNYLPIELKVMDPFDFGWFAGNILLVGGACGITTGLGCAGALAFFGFGSFYLYVISGIDWFNTLIVIPMVITMIFIMARLGRGGG